MNTTINNIYEIITAEGTAAVEKALIENEDTIRNAIIEIETKYQTKAVRARFYIDAADNIRFRCKAWFDTKEEHAEEAKIINDKSLVEIFIFRHSDADPDHTSEEFAAEHADDVLNMIEYYIANHEHVIVL